MKVVKLDCKHLYHTKCLRNWLEEKDTCPMCRCDVSFKSKKRKAEELEQN